MISDTIVHALVAVLVVIAVAAVARFEIGCLRELAQTPDIALRGLNRAGWLAVIVLSIPIGGICFMYYGRTR